MFNIHILGELEVAVKNTGIHFGIYYSLLEWFHPLYDQDKGNFTTLNIVSISLVPELIK